MTLTGFERTQFFCGLIFLWRKIPVLLQQERKMGNSTTGRIGPVVLKEYAPVAQANLNFVLPVRDI
jgi:hypothetical protein